MDLLRLPLSLPAMIQVSLGAHDRLLLQYNYVVPATIDWCCSTGSFQAAIPPFYYGRQPLCLSRDTCSALSILVWHPQDTCRAADIDARHPQGSYFTEGGHYGRAENISTAAEKHLDSQLCPSTAAGMHHGRATTLFHTFF